MIHALRLFPSKQLTQIVEVHNNEVFMYRMISYRRLSGTVSRNAEILSAKPFRSLNVTASCNSFMNVSILERIFLTCVLENDLMSMALRCITGNDNVEE